MRLGGYRESKRQRLRGKRRKTEEEKQENKNFFLGWILSRHGKIIGEKKQGVVKTRNEMFKNRCIFP